MAKVSTAEIDELEGLTTLECPILCEKGRCVITGWDHCGHPNKGGLQGAEMQKPETVRRYRDARLVLAQQKLDKKAKEDK